MSPKRPALYRNMLSYLGGIAVVCSSLLILLFVLLELTAERANPYLGIITYLTLPAGIFGGIVLVLYGMRRESLRRRKNPDAAPFAFPRLDLNDPKQRVRFALGVVGGGLLLVIVAVVAYKGFHFTESTTFCGQVCHTVMQPEYELHQRSSHARVPCVSCHVGEGVDWYVKSKLSGVRQVIAVLRDNYQRPIPTPVEHLRPARETCERCHWPEKFFAAQYLQLPHFRYDAQTKPEQISLNLKTGGGKPDLGQSGGVHWHMLSANKVSYVAVDKALQHIAVVRTKRLDGREEEFRSLEHQLPPGGGQRERVMDCMDCHNRPSHRVDEPEEAINKAIAHGSLSTSLPHLKLAAVEALVVKYETKEAAHAGIRAHLTKFYERRYPEHVKSPALDAAVRVLLAIHDRNVYPKMKVGFGTYPSNIGHRNWPGCFRCHDGRHVSDEGRVITNDCSACHSKPERGPATPLGVAQRSPEADWHPYPLKGGHEKLLCHKCHASGTSPTQTCQGCHDVKGSGTMMEKMSCGECHLQTNGAERPSCSNASCHLDVGGLHQTKGHDVDCVRCHAPHTWTSTQTVCVSCHGEKVPSLSVDRGSLAIDRQRRDRSRAVTSRRGNQIDRGSLAKPADAWK